MPFYEYECPVCGVCEEHYRRVEYRNRCPSCLVCHGADRLPVPTMTRTISAPGVIFKGSGWPGQEIKRKNHG